MPFHKCSSASLAISRKRERRVRQDRSLTRGAAHILFHFGSPIPETTCAHQCCASTFASFSSPQMSSCSCWKTVRSDAQTTTRGHPDRTCGNTARPRKRLEALPDQILVLSGMPYRALGLQGGAWTWALCMRIPRTAEQRWASAHRTTRPCRSRSAPACQSSSATILSSGATSSP